MQFAALKAEEENDSVGTAVGHGLAGPKTPAMSRRIAGESGLIVWICMDL